MKKKSRIKYDIPSSSELFYDELVEIWVQPQRPIISYENENKIFVLDALETVGKGIYRGKWTGNEHLAVTEHEAEALTKVHQRWGDPELQPPFLKYDEEARKRFEDAAGNILTWLANNKLKGHILLDKANKWHEIPAKDWRQMSPHLIFRRGRARLEKRGGKVDYGTVFVFKRMLESNLAGLLHKRGIGIVARTGAAGRPTSIDWVLEEFEKMAQRGPLPATQLDTAKILAEWLRTSEISPLMTPYTIRRHIAARFREIKSKSH